MKRAEMGMFVNYLEYKAELSDEKIKNMTEDEFNLFKNYFFKEIEGHELDGDYADYKEYVNGRR